MALTPAQKGQITRAINERSEIRNGKLVLAGAVALETLAEIDPGVHAQVMETDGQYAAVNDGYLDAFWEAANGAR